MGGEEEWKTEGKTRGGGRDRVAGPGERMLERCSGAS